MYTRQVTPSYSVAGNTREEVSSREREFRADFDQYKRLCQIPLANVCWTQIKGEYVDNVAEMRRVMATMTHLSRVLVENGEIFMNGNLEAVDPADIFYETWSVCRAMPDNTHFIVTLYDDAEFGQGCMKALRYVVKPGLVAMQDIRREGVMERTAVLQKKLNDIQSEMAILTHVMQQLEIDEAAPAVALSEAEIASARSMPGASWDDFVPEDDVNPSKINFTAES